ncbi:MAG: desulfoferrodoxin [Candidatus Pacebacteria bacterium]|nr:desulfoferrodoxin [Candidatus Paceibacterota bacterium]MDR3583567.1 desulfoferrodoxin [Candidatus Paceibacterota bacterium]
MTEQKQIYKCNICGNMVEMVHTGAGELVCCGQNMEWKQEKNDDEGMEKHKPVIERTDSGVIVKVGSVPHPMESAHYIEWIEVITEHRVYRKKIDINQDPWAEFFLEAEHIKARAYCNVHGLWSSEEVINL